MAAGTGLYTTDGIPAQILYTEIARSVELYNHTENQFKELFCKDTRKKTVRVPQRSMQFHTASDTGDPEWSQLNNREYTLPDPIAYELAEGYTKHAWEQGLSADEVRQQRAEAIKADSRLIQQIVLKEMLTDSGWWDASMSTAPPTFKSNSFATTHDHYLAANVAGVPTKAHFDTMKGHIIEHGYGPTLVAFINHAQATAIEAVAEWQTTNNYVSTSTIDFLQKVGLWPSTLSSNNVLMASGVPVLVEDWVPAYYMLMVAVNDVDKPLRWRLPESTNGVEGLITDTDDTFKWMITKFRRWTSAKIVHQGAGCAYYLNSATWTDASFEY